MKIVSESLCFGGRQLVFEHEATSTKCVMRFAAYMPPGDATRKWPTLFWLSGLTCTEQNFITKAGAQRAAAALGLVIIAPDTSPRGPSVPDDPEEAYDFGLGAGFYVNATEAPWSTHYRMRDYVETELFDLVVRELPVDAARVGISGHSMGGHGALTMALRSPAKFKSVSAFAPIVSTMNCPWGEKALSGYLGADRALWRNYDATALIEDGRRISDILVDQGLADNFLQEQLKPELLEAACKNADQKLTLRRHPGYDHSYYFIASFIDDHITWHAERLAG